MAKKREEQSGSGFFWGLVLGIAVGAALAVLFAPQTGEETREKLLKQSGEVLKQSGDLRERGQSRAEEMKSQFRERYSDALVMGKEAYDRAKDEVQVRYAKAKNV